jgi:hypothetical protein
MHGNDSRTMVKAHVVAGATTDASAERADQTGER